MVGSACGRSLPTSAIRMRSMHSWRAGCLTPSSNSESCFAARVACDEQIHLRGEQIVQHREQLAVIRGPGAVARCVQSGFATPNRRKRDEEDAESQTHVAGEAGAEV